MPTIHFNKDQENSVVPYLVRSSYCRLATDAAYNQTDNQISRSANQSPGWSVKQLLNYKKLKYCQTADDKSWEFIVIIK